MTYINNQNFSKAIQFIFNNIDKPITLDNMANHLAISVSSLKRLFEEATGQLPGAFIRKMRMELAFCSLQSKDQSILEIGMDSGFQNHAAFSRQFKKSFGFSPTSVREETNIINELEHIVLEEPAIVELADINIQCITASAKLYYECAPLAWQLLMQKLNDIELNEDFSGLFVGISHDNPHNPKQDQLKFSAGVIFDTRNIEAELYTIKGGCYARFRYKGKPNNIGKAYHYIYGKWQSNSSIRINFHLPPFQIFDSIPDNLSENNVLINIPIIYE